MDRKVKGLSLELALQYVMPALRPGPFKDSVCRNPPQTMEELRQRAADEAQVENMKQNHRREQQEAKAEKNDNRKAEGSGNRPTGPKLREGPRGPRFPHYTPLNAPRTRILQEALSTQILPAPAKRPTPPGADLSKHCLYHQNSGHDTEDCVTLKDKIEELIHMGRLQQYVKREDVRRQEELPRSEHPYTRFKSPPWERRKEGRSHRDYDRPPRDEGRLTAQRDRSRSRGNEQRGPLRGMINTIFGGFAGGGPTSSARKRSIRALRSIHTVDVPRRTMPPITFSDEDFHAPDPDQDDPMVIDIEVARYRVSRVLVDQGSSVNILYWKIFLQMDILEDLIVPYNEQIVGFVGERVDTRGYIDLHTRLGTGRESGEMKVRFLLVEAHTSYNVLIGRPCLNAFGAIVSTPHLTMKYPTQKGTICTVRANQKTARECYATGLRIYPKEERRKMSRSEVALADLDPRTNTEDRLEPVGETQPIMIARGLPAEIEKEL
ncbi:uncharacterized protein LOC106780034 [Vigna radiata var. radiata]|uniref:Uncharacterized protein LOC106780034 n=1 Tax=Vigna radiata var. radiata TaxID=3916 RepID=A0A1S3VZL5_VIGRR|nr:uncharacterized protein LOC106780034 [Vigna radiata var. radiata]